MDNSLKVIIVEDDIDLRESTIEFLNLSGFEVRGVGSGLEFYQAMSEHSYNVAILDIGLPDQSGYLLAEYVRKNTSMGIIILTARVAAEDKLQGYDSGADIYLVKPVDCRELAAAIKNLSLRLKHNDATTQPGTWTLAMNAWYLATPAKELISLTSKELQFMACLAHATDQKVSRHEILEKLGYNDDEYTNRALDSLVRRLRRKIEDKYPASPPLKTMHAIGYCFTAPLSINQQSPACC